MTKTSKMIGGGVTLMACGLALIGWNARDPDSAYREPAKEERVVQLEQVPAPVQATIRRVSTGGTIEEIQKERKGDKVTYEVDVVGRSAKFEYEIAEDGVILQQESKKLKQKSRT